MTSPGPFGRRQSVARVPTGEVIAEFESYPEAAKVVDRLAKADFPVAKLSIVGSGLKTVERVTRKRSWGRAALEGLLAGAWFGLFIALVFSLMDPEINGALFGAAILIGAGFGMFFRLFSYGVSRRSRDFESTSQVVAVNYQVISDTEVAPQAREALGRPAE